MPYGETKYQVPDWIIGRLADAKTAIGLELKAQEVLKSSPETAERIGQLSLLYLYVQNQIDDTANSF